MPKRRCKFRNCKPRQFLMQYPQLSVQLAPQPLLVNHYLPTPTLSLQLADTRACCGTYSYLNLPTSDYRQYGTLGTLLDPNIYVGSSTWGGQSTQRGSRPTRSCITRPCTTSVRSPGTTTQRQQVSDFRCTTVLSHCLLLHILYVVL